MFRLLKNFFLFSIISVVLIKAGKFFWIPFLIIFAFFLYRYFQAKKIQPTSECPFCGNKQLEVSTIHSQTSFTSNTSGQRSSSYGLFSGSSTWNSQTNSLRNYVYTHEAKCQECGHLFNYLTVDEANKIKKKATKMMVLAGLLFISSIPSSFFLMHLDHEIYEEKQSESYKYLWLVEPTPIKDFDYKVNKNDNTVVFREYTGSSYKEKIHIASSYEIEGIIYNVIELENVKLGNSDRRSVIIEDGIRYLNNDLLKDGENIEAVYLPATLENISSDFFGGFNKNLNDVYFSGNEDDFARIFGSQAINNYLQTVLVHYNCSIDQLLADAPTE